VPLRPRPDDPPSRPGGERAALLSFLEFYRAVLARKLDGLGAEQMNRTLGPSTLTLGGLLTPATPAMPTCCARRSTGRSAIGPPAEQTWPPRR
jgi:hypothetical protein